MMNLSRLDLEAQLMSEEADQGYEVRTTRHRADLVREAAIEVRSLRQELVSHYSQYLRDVKVPEGSIETRVHGAQVRRDHIKQLIESQESA